MSRSTQPLARPVEYKPNSIRTRVKTSSLPADSRSVSCIYEIPLEQGLRQVGGGQSQIVALEYIRNSIRTLRLGAHIELHSCGKNILDSIRTRITTH